MDLSIVFSTFKSEAILEKSLKGYCEIVTDYQWELIIIDNACRQETRDIIQRYQNLLPIVFLEQPIPGKNSALNLALPLIKSELVFFTDNDVIPASDIINVYVNASIQYPEYHIFGGKIRPDRDLPHWIDVHNQPIQAAFVIMDLGDSDKEVDPVSKIWGPNMAIRNTVFNKGITFNDKIGPNGKDYVMGSETELLQRLKEKGFRAMYVAALNVKHQIRDEQISIHWLAKRAFRAGKGLGYINKDDAIVSNIFGYPRFLVRIFLADIIQVVVSIEKNSRCKAIMKLYNTAGQLKQSKQ